jgi:histidinol dehydrogenase
MKTYRNPQSSTWAALSVRPLSNQVSLTSITELVFENVRINKDKAVRLYTKQFDSIDIDTLVVTLSYVRRQANTLPLDIRDAIDKAYENVYTFHQAQLNDPQAVISTMPGVVCWREARPIDRVGLYVPGGSAPLVSTVIMLGVPARIAGCKQVVLATPPDKNGDISPAICYAALKIGVTTIIRVGGIQAIAAMTLGTQSIPAVDKLYGPGNQYVMAAKQYALKYGVASDMPAGPSEVLVIADETADPSFVAADLLSQAEHGPDSQVVLVTTSEKMLEATQIELSLQLDTLPRKEIAQKALNASFAVVMDTVSTAMKFANIYAPEHIILSVKSPRQVAKMVINAGSVFLGKYSPESAGDYASGTNHTLPTNRWARSYSGLSVNDYIKTVSFQQLTKSGLQSLSNTIGILARVEGLEAHARAVDVRFGKNNNDVS